MELAAILIWLKNNWKLIVGALVVLVILGLFAYTFERGYEFGKAQQLAADQKVIDGIHDEAQAAQDKLQKSADKKAGEYETARTTAQQKLSAAQKELAREKITHSAYNTCHVDPDFMQLYSGIAATSGKGDVPASPH